MTGKKKEIRCNRKKTHLTSLGHVAEKNSVCRSAGIDRTIRWICGSKPMSSMRSASSRTRYEIWCSRTMPPSRKSLRRPGVAMTSWTPKRRSRSCGPLEAPPGGGGRRRSFR